jgi:hypothetical protein
MQDAIGLKELNELQWLRSSPRKAATQRWIPACAGMNGVWGESTQPILP